jgi:predicted porin
MSKRTDVYAAVRDTSYTHAGWTDTKVMGAGIRHRF